MHVHCYIFLLLPITTFCREYMQMQDFFKGLDGPAAAMRDECFQEHSLTIDDIHNHPKGEEVPEHELCFYKCFYEKIYVLDDEGNVTSTLEEVEEIKELEEAEREELMTCVKSAGKILSCKDMKRLEMCFEGVL